MFLWFWDNVAPGERRYWAVQRECHNAALLQMIQAAVNNSSEPIYLKAEPKTHGDAVKNLHAFSDEGRKTCRYKGRPDSISYSSTPRLRRCYGWTKVHGKDLWALGPALQPPDVTIGGIRRHIRRDEEYYAIVYEFLSEGKISTNAAAVQQELDFFWRVGFCFVPLRKVNWIDGVLLDMADIVCPWHAAWHYTRYKRYVRCDEFCTFCSTTYTQAHKYIGHKCVSRGPEHQRAYIKTRVDALRDRARRELSDKDNIDKLQPDLNHAKRLKPVHPRSTDDASIVSFPRLHTVNALREPHLSHATPGSLAQSVPATTVSVALDELNAHQPANSPATQPAHNVDMDGVASFTYQPYNLTPLFSPLNSDWQSQLQLPDPLWALQPANSEGSLMGFLGGLSSSKDLVGVVEPSDDVASSEPSFAM
ncbi:hypothetical protein BN1723_009783 [Verticillium longisporum]|uniref:C2H2-type domain-containing protein n=1 Tax=Verticillium longisporum TaxID=100787 RepID=A0A0G4KSM3_VERLO|nr:hypothetical protein BN1723_009783 [Verticillium longisporum]